MKPASLCCVLLALLICCITVSNAAYFYLLDTEPSCFLEDIPEDTAIVVKYVNIDMEQIGLGLGGNQQIARITVTDPNSRIVSTTDTEKKGQIAFTSKISGDHKICVDMIHSPRHGRQYKFGLKVQSAAETADFSNMAKHEHFNAIIVELTKLNDRIVNHRKEHKYLKKLEEKTRDETEDVYEKVLYFCLFQTVVILGAMIFQIVKLRLFFKTKFFSQ